MTKKKIKEIKTICGNLSWNVIEDEDGEITGVETWACNSGENIVIDCCESTEDFLDVLDSKVREFDIDEYVDIYASSRGRNGVPSTYQSLIEAGNEQFELMDKLNDALRVYR